MPVMIEVTNPLAREQDKAKIVAIKELLEVPQDRAGRFSTELFERYQRSEKALVGDVCAGRIDTESEGGH
jgi:transposase-like protein